MLRFSSLTAQTAPEPSRPILSASEKRFGFLPSPVARAAHAPALLSHLMASFAAFDKTSLTAVEREVVAMTVAFENGCHYCMALHSTTLATEHAELTQELRAGTALSAPRLEAIRLLVVELLRERGQLSGARRAALAQAGLTERETLEVVLGVGVYVLSTFANLVTEAPLDAPLAAARWEDPRGRRAAAAASAGDG